jgi:hypothetical protein
MFYVDNLLSLFWIDIYLLLMCYSAYALFEIFFVYCYLNFHFPPHRMNHEGSIVQEDGEISPPGEQYHIALETRRETERDWDRNRERNRDRTRRRSRYCCECTP